MEIMFVNMQILL